ncbi:PadR family transcriptional regulator [Pseudofrankia inefficax]|uniref:Transcriptional regulator, PadR-like family n=1 Tax=Pseudofrankia inefficax (strain DSM 45817 / CECT 9037 / DDB 130130 / EuI1c) TaxID=298654 RepID=E3J441_PSEI1|nr:PadR family transcriptional regulator [Pseudofrankia inefficax]ADP81820.1 transcriptional regulator, PadR-like family [Pseudofrankia inefficax]
MAARRKVGNLLGLAVLAYLSRAPMHPYELSRTLRDHGDDRSIKFNHGSLYMVVQQLAKAGFITELATTREGQRPERTVYAITPAGRDELHDWLRELVARPEHEYPSFVSALSLVGALHPDDVVEQLRARLTGLAARRAEIQKMIDDSLAEGVPELFLIEEEFRAAQLDTEAAFVERLITRIADPDVGWGPAWAAFHTALAAETPAQPNA